MRCDAMLIQSCPGQSSGSITCRAMPRQAMLWHTMLSGAVLCYTYYNWIQLHTIAATDIMWWKRETKNNWGLHHSSTTTSIYFLPKGCATFSLPSTQCPSHRSIWSESKKATNPIAWRAGSVEPSSPVPAACYSHHCGQQVERYCSPSKLFQHRGSHAASSGDHHLIFSCKTCCKTCKTPKYSKMANLCCTVKGKFYECLCVYLCVCVCLSNDFARANLSDILILCGVFLYPPYCSRPNIPIRTILKGSAVGNTRNSVSLEKFRHVQTLFPCSLAMTGQVTREPLVLWNGSLRLLLRPQCFRQLLSLPPELEEAGDTLRSSIDEKLQAGNITGTHTTTPGHGCQVFFVQHAWHDGAVGHPCKGFPVHHAWPDANLKGALIP